MCYTDSEIEEWERKEEARRRYEHYLTQAPERYRNESFASFHASTDIQERALKAARVFAAEVQCGRFVSLVFLGGAGTGKTHLALSVIRETGRGRYKLSSRIVDELRAAKSYSAKDTESTCIRRHGESSLLVIDEIGRCDDANTERYMLYQILNERYNRKAPTILISNKSKKEFLDYIGIAAADRLTESARVIELNGTSYRAELRKALRV